MDSKAGATRGHVQNTATIYRVPKHYQERQADQYQQRSKSPNNPKHHYSKGEYYSGFKVSSNYNQPQGAKRASYRSNHVQEESDSDFEEEESATQPSRRNTGARKDLNRSEVMNMSYMEEDEEENDFKSRSSMRSTKLREEHSVMKKLPAGLFQSTTQRFQSHLASEENELKLLTRHPLEKFKDCKALYTSALKVTDEVIYKYETQDLKEFNHITSETQQLSLRAKKVQKIK